MATVHADPPREELDRLLAELMTLQQHIGHQLGARAVEELRCQIAGDHPLSVLIVGEFNAGKTTLVNALLGEAILPTGIVPTTATVNVIVNGAEHTATVAYRDGRQDRCPWDPHALQQFTARNGDQEEIAYITLASPRVPPGLRLIDTPGVNDICETRADIVYEWIPKADLVLFVMNAEHALKQSEAEFLRQRVLGQTLTRVCFVLNHADRLSADELTRVRGQVLAGLSPIYAEYASQLRDAQACKLAQDVATASADIQVLHLSARAALREQNCNGEANGGLGKVQSLLRLRMETSQRRKLSALKTLSAAMLECSGTEAFLDAAMCLRASSERSRAGFLQTLVPRLENALVSLEKLYGTIGKMGSELDAHAATRFGAVKHEVLRQINDPSFAAEADLASVIESTYRRALEAELEHVNTRLSTEFDNLASLPCLSTDFAISAAGLPSDRNPAAKGDDPLGSFIQSCGGREWLMLFVPIMIWQLGWVGIVAGCAVPAVLRWFRQGNAEQERVARVQEVLSDVERQLGNSFRRVVESRLVQMAGPTLRSVDLLQASMRVALGEDETIELDALARDRAQAEKLKERLALLAHSVG